MSVAMKNLPEELILEILLRLPVKSLLRFRSVCKSWLSVISNPQFAKSHFDLAAAQTDRILFVAVDEVRSVDFEASFHDVSASVKLNFPLTPPFSNVGIRGSCRGFLLLDYYRNFFVYNPSTGVCRRISEAISSNTELAPVFHGIGYDSSKDDYLVVLGSREIGPDWDFITQFEIFSFKINSWKKIESTDFPYSDSVDKPRVGLLLNGVLHWFAFNYWILDNVILAFDLKEEKPKELPWPCDFYYRNDYCDLLVIGGCLTLSTIESGTTHIWVMKEYGVRSSWVKSIVLSHAATTHNYISPICSTKSGGIVGQDDGVELMKYNHRGDLLEYRAYSDIPHSCGAAVYTESLLSLPSGNEEGE